MNILAIGNSYSEDCTKYLQTLNKDLYVRNMYIGGCSLEKHYKNLFTNWDEYVYQADGVDCLDGKKINFEYAFSDKEWDVITVQQVSWLAGVYESYSPYIDKLLEVLRARFPKAKIYVHETWAYPTYTRASIINLYEHDQAVMDKKIQQSVKKVSKKYDLDIIPVGEFIMRLRKLKKFTEKDGKSLLYADDIHLSRDYGRYAGALCWNYFITGEKSAVIPETLNPKTVKIIQDQFDKFIKVYKK